MRKFNCYVFALFLLMNGIILTSCVSNRVAEQSQTILYQVISGTVMYPNNLYFPTRVRMEINLTAENLSTQEQIQLVSQSIRNPQRFPVNFILRYDPNDIIHSFEYSIIVKLYRELEENPYLVSPAIVLPALTGDENLIIELHPFMNTIR